MTWPPADDLDAVLDAVWTLLVRGVHDRRVPAHTPTVATVDFPPSCSSADCVTLLYAPVGVPWVERLMDRYAELAQVNSSLETTFQFNISIRVVFCRCLATP